MPFASTKVTMTSLVIGPLVKRKQSVYP